MVHMAIAGAGIGGLAAAVALARAGCQVSVLERSPAPAETGAGLQLSPNATVLLRKWNILHQLSEAAVVPEAVLIRGGRDGRDIARIPLGTHAERRFGSPFLLVRRADLHRVLLGHARSLGVAVQTGAAVEGWEETASGLRVLHGGPQPNSVLTDGLVGADGLRSTVRAAIQGTRDREATRSRGSAWRTTIQTAALPALFGAPMSNLWLGPDAHLVHYPVAGGAEVNVVAAVQAPRGSFDQDRPAERGDPAVLRSRFSAWTRPVREVIAAAPEWRAWPLIDRPALRRWTVGRVTLLGDAAHPSLPFLAQGAAQAIEDAGALADGIGVAGTDVEKAFGLYESIRRKKATRVQTESRRQGAIYHLAAPASLARDLALRALGPERLLARYDWLYATST